MSRISRSLAFVLVLGLIVLVLLPAGACKSKSQAPGLTEEELLAADQAEAEEEEAAKAAAAKVVPPKVNEEIYIEMRARSVLIRQKYIEEFETGEKEVEALLDKNNLTFSDMKEFETRVGQAVLDQLERKIQEKMQKLLDEYR